MSERVRLGQKKGCGKVQMWLEQLAQILCWVLMFVVLVAARLHVVECGVQEGVTDQEAVLLLVVVVMS